MKAYIVGITIHNAFYVKAETPDDARQKVRDMDTLDILNDADFNITYTDEQKGGEA